MVAIVSQDTAHARLQALETTSKRHLVDAANHWMAFRVIAQEIKDNELYKLSEHKTWHEYVRATWDIDSSKIRQYKMILPYANVLLEVLPSVTVEVETMKKLRQVAIPLVENNMPLAHVATALGVRFQVLSKFLLSEGYMQSAWMYRKVGRDNKNE